MRMMAQMISRPFRAGVLQGPTTGDQQAAFHPIRTFEAAMRQQPVVSDGDAQAGDDVQDGKHRPIQPGISIEESIPRDADHRACDDRPEEEVGPELMMHAVDDVRRNRGRGNVLHVATIVKRKTFRKGLCARASRVNEVVQSRPLAGPSSTVCRRPR